MRRILLSVASLVFVSVCATTSAFAATVSPPAAAHYSLSLLAVPFNSITGTVTGVHYDANGEIDRFTVTKDGAHTIIHVDPPSGPVTDAIENFLNQPATVEYDVAGNPPKKIYTGIGTPDP